MIIVLSTITELSWTPPAPPIFTSYVAAPLLIDADSDPSSLSVNKSPKGKYAALACHETGLLVVQRAKNGIVDELLGQGAAVLSEVAKSRRAPSASSTSPEKHRRVTLEHSLTACSRGREGDARLHRGAHVRPGEWVDLAPPLTGSQLIASVLAMADKDQRASPRFTTASADTLRGRKTGSMVIWLLYVHPVQFLLYPLSCVLFSTTGCAPTTRY
ncbi:hypothetical protein B0H14DRAFT_3513304 [Mycena olivaceomarginata]|nr:hypothetical protein B0H14DRAFT_3513304 [Mycena olivaceomarginata]